MIYLIVLILFLGSLIGALGVFFINKVDSKLSKSMYGFSSGVMMAAAIFSLIVPAMDFTSFDNSKYNEIILVLLTTVGFICGFLFMIFMEKLSGKIIDKKLLKNNDIDKNIDKKVENNNKSKRLKRSILLFIAITVHNIPEGIVAGIGMMDTTNIIAAISLAIGIAVQNIPEGIISSVPFKEETGSKLNAFILGILSGIIEPIFAVIAFNFVSGFGFIMPCILTFAASTMIFVVLKELIPNCLYFEDDMDDSSNIGMISFLVGFVIMMILDLVLS